MKRKRGIEKEAFIASVTLGGSGKIKRKKSIPPREEKRCYMSVENH